MEAQQATVAGEITIVRAGTGKVEIVPFVGIVTHEGEKNGGNSLDGNEDGDCKFGGAPG